MKVEVGSNVAIIDDDGNTLPTVEPYIKDKIDEMHQQFRQQVEDYVKKEMNKPDGNDYDRAMGIVR